MSLIIANTSGKKRTGYAMAKPNVCSTICLHIWIVVPRLACEYIVKTIVCASLSIRIPNPGVAGPIPAGGTTFQAFIVSSVYEFCLERYSASNIEYTYLDSAN